MKFIVLLALIPLIYSLDNGLARTPAMAWNSWNKFACSINETLVKEIADAIVSTGLKDAGYQFVNLDDCWQLSRDPTTNVIQADNQTFPSGIPSLVDYVHGLGLKFGLYSDAGTKTCQGRPGSLGHETIDANTYAQWGVDYLKYDNCNNDLLPPQIRYPRMRNALNATGRPIYFSMCEWGNQNPWNWAGPVANSWRTTGDIKDTWDSVMKILEDQAPISNIGAPGAWNDPDMLEVGNGGMTTTEYQSHFALWAFMKAPLIIGCDVRNMTNDTFAILSNKEIIAINQDSLGKPATRVYNQDNQQIWGGPISDGYAAVLLNTGGAAVNITFNFTLLGIQGQVSLRDLVSHKDLGNFQASYTAEVESHGVIALKITQQSSQEEEESHDFLPIDYDIIC